MPPDAARVREEGLMAAASAHAPPSQPSPLAPPTWGPRHQAPQLPWVCQRRSTAEGLRGGQECELGEGTPAACPRGASSLSSAEPCSLRACSTACSAGHTPCQTGAGLGRPWSSPDEAPLSKTAPGYAQLRRGTRDDVTGAVLASHPRTVAQALPSERASESSGEALGRRETPNAESVRSAHNSHSRNGLNSEPPSLKESNATSSPSWATSDGSEAIGAPPGGSGGPGPEGIEEGWPLHALWHALRSVAVGEAAVLALFLLLFVSSLGGRHAAAWVVPWGLARLFGVVSLLGIALELQLVGDSFKSHFQLRPGASPGLHMGAMALPAALLARAVLHSAWTGAPAQGSPSALPSTCPHIRLSEHVPCAPSVLDLHCWGALSCAASALAGALALWATRRGHRSSGGKSPSSPHRLSEVPAAEGRAADLRRREAAAGRAPRGEEHCANGYDTPLSSTGKERSGAESGVLLRNDLSDLGPFFMGWGAATACVAAAAAACWGVSAGYGFGLGSSKWVLGPLVWLLSLSLLSSLVFARTLRLFPSSFSAGEAMLASQGLTLYAGDALGMTLSRLAPALPLPPFGAPFSATGDQIHAIIQAMVLGLLLLPATGTALTRLISSALAPAPQPRNGRSFKNRSSSSESESGTSKYGKLVAQGEGEGSDTGGGDACAGTGSASGGAEGQGEASRTVGFAVGAVLVVCVGAPLWLRWVGGMTQHPVLWALLQILEDPQPRASLCFYWLATGLLPLPLLQRAAAAGVVPQIILRKAYHLMAVAMFVPAMLLQPGFLRLAFGVALCAFLFLEVLRVCRVAPLGPLLDRFMLAFADARDSGPIIVSHFSLLLGCALPLWLAPYPSATHPAATGAPGPACLAPFAGMLSIGIGDTMASAVGKRFGRHKIARDSPKTVEGTLACVAFTFAACAGLVPALCAIHGCTFSARDWGHVLVATAVSGLLEAYTEQLDNAFVPLLCFASLAVL